MGNLLLSPRSFMAAASPQCMVIPGNIVVAFLRIEGIQPRIRILPAEAVIRALTIAAN
jgi:hypothetical protein